MTFGNMSYYDIPGGMPSSNLKYTGQTAQGYDAKREESPKWKIEQEIIEKLLSDLPAGTWVLDAPCGTGRFFDYYLKRQFIIRGLDLSPEMLDLAAAKVGNESRAVRLVQPDGKQVETPQLSIAQGNVLSSGIPDNSIDAAVNCRITRWLSPDECQQMFREMQRICRDRIILTARVANHSHARPLQLFELAMGGDWQLEHSIAGYSPEYRVFQFRCKTSPLLKTAGQTIDAALESSADGSWTMKPYEAA